MKKAFQKIGKYLIMVLLLLIGLACAGVLYLFFVPGSNLFNITYISYNHSQESDKYKVVNSENEAKNINKVILNSHNYDVRVVTTSEDSVYVKVHNNSFGFVLTENSTVNIKQTRTADALEFTISEPHGFALPNTSYIELYIPKSNEIDLSLKNNSAYTKISSEGLMINDLSYESKFGNADLETASVTGDLSLNLGNATFTIGSSADVDNSEVKLNLTTGKFDATSSILGDVTVESNERGVILIKECQNFYEEVETAGGRIEIDKIYYAHIATSDTNVKIKEVTNNVILSLTKSGSVEIDNLSGISSVSTKEGDIKITKATSSELFLESSNGNITVNTAYNYVNAITNHGQINISYAKREEGEERASSKERSLNVKINGNGKVVATAVENVNIDLKENGRAEITMATVHGKNVISGNSGSVYVKIDQDAKFRLETISTSGAVKVNLSQVPNFNGYTTGEKTTTYVNSYKEDYTEITDENPDAVVPDSENWLTIRTESGSLTVLDTRF